MSTRASRPAGPWRLTLVTNPDDCNLTCAMCECGAARAAGAPRAAPRRMAERAALALLEEAAALGVREVIPSTMGEPLLWAGLDALLARARALGVAVNLTTNGTFPGRGAASWAAMLVPACSDVKVSWNGATAATAAEVMPGLDLAAAVEGVAALVAARDRHAPAGGRRCQVSFQVTAQEANVGELAAIVRLAARLGVDRVKLNHLQVRRPELAQASLRRDAAALARWNASVREARAAAEETPRAGGGRVALQNAVELALDPAAPAPRGPCPFVGREAWVHADGRFAPCPHPAALEGALGDFGRVGGGAGGTLAAAWEGPALRALVLGWERHPVCAACAFRRPGGA